MGEYVNSQNARFDRSTISCGVTEVHHLPRNQSAARILFAIANHLYHKANPRPGAFVQWSDVVDGVQTSQGVALAAHISRNVPDIGVLQETPPSVNPRTGNTIRVWTLTLNHDTFRRWYQDELANRIEE